MSNYIQKILQNLKPFQKTLFIQCYFTFQSAQRRIRAMVSTPVQPHLHNGGSNPHGIDTAGLTLAAQKLEI